MKNAAEHALCSDGSWWSQEKLKEEERQAAGPEKQLEEKRKELDAVKEKAQEQLEKVYEAKRVLSAEQWPDVVDSACLPHRAPSLALLALP